jgi:hypothetical protein
LGQNLGQQGRLFLEQAVRSAKSLEFDDKKARYDETKSEIETNRAQLVRDARNMATWAVQNIASVPSTFDRNDKAITHLRNLLVDLGTCSASYEDKYKKSALWISGDKYGIEQRQQAGENFKLIHAVFEGCKLQEEIEKGM